MLKEVLLGLLTGAVAFTVGILLGHFAINKGTSVPEWVHDASQDVDERIITKLLEDLDNIQIQENLRWYIYTDEYMSKQVYPIHCWS